ncbi:MarR family winged helix-turn-helix transcriptional regulator [Solicola sp. PLA-1-18]|uniref:MarR family winged helix-turn-helix transcriptional regulator n=1 Tax=Solicola sp. PLA-1-18 TaxID=3380532 RepID=UPI003B82A284
MSPTSTATTDETRWLDRRQQGAWRSFLGGSTVLMDCLDRDLRTEHDLSMAEYEILVRLSESSERTLRMAELASMVAHSRSRVTHTVARLERVGILHRQPCKDDGRGVEAVLTDHGFSVLEQASHTHVAGVRKYLVDRATPDELDAIGRVMERIVTDLEGNRF